MSERTSIAAWRAGTDENATGAFSFAVSTGNGISFAASGDADLVFRAWGEFEEKVMKTGAAKPAAPQQKFPSTDPAMTANGRSGTEEEPLSVFLERHTELDSNPKVALAIVAWSKRYRSVDSVTPTEVKRLWRDTSHAVPANVPRELANAVKPGWLVRLGAGRYGTSGFGERFLHSLSQ